MHYNFQTGNYTLKIGAFLNRRKAKTVLVVCIPKSRDDIEKSYEKTYPEAGSST